VSSAAARTRTARVGEAHVRRLCERRYAVTSRDAIISPTESMRERAERHTWGGTGCGEIGNNTTRAL